jgi:hypothetical protein
LAELADIFKTRDAAGAPQRVFELAQQKLSAIRTDIIALGQTERYGGNTTLLSQPSRIMTADAAR